jgi:site-specific recombinase XerD
VRVSELCGLDLTDVDLDRELAYVTGKGSRPRVVPFGAKTAQAVDRYLRVRALHPYALSSRLLLGQRGPMTPDGARDVLHTRAARPASPTSIRTGSDTLSPTTGSPVAARSGT